MYERAGKGLTQTNGGVMPKEFEDGRSLEKKTDAYGEIADIFPALQKYKDEHNAANLQKLMVEILEFCRSVYASTQNEAERDVYRSMVQKLNN